jgi:hypothetical protein
MKQTKEKILKHEKKKKRNRKVQIDKFIFRDTEYANLTKHEIQIHYINNIGEKSILTIPPSGIEARYAYSKECAPCLSEVLPVKYKTSSKLLFYQNGQNVSYKDVISLIGSAIPIVSHICLTATFSFFGKAIAPDSEENVKKGGEKIGTKGFITLKSNGMYY